MGERREKQTLIPAFDPSLLARELEDAAERPTLAPAFDPTSYARMVDDHLERALSSQAETPRTMTAATPALDGAPVEPSEEEAATIGRAMYGRYLSSDYPAALVLAERVLEREPDHALAKLVVDGCRERLGASGAPRLSPSSVLRLKRQPFELVELVEIGGIESAAVLAQIDGIADVAQVAELAGIPRPQALDRLHTLLQMGLLEVVDG